MNLNVFMVVTVLIGLSLFLTCTTASTTVNNRILDNLLASHHNNSEVFQVLDAINKKCPDITYIYDIGKSVYGVH